MPKRKEAKLAAVAWIGLSVNIVRLVITVWVILHGSSL